MFLIIRLFQYGSYHSFLQNKVLSYLHFAITIFKSKITGSCIFNTATFHFLATFLSLLANTQFSFKTQFYKMSHGLSLVEKEATQHILQSISEMNKRCIVNNR